MSKKHIQNEICGHSDQKYPKKIVRFGQKLVPFWLLSQLTTLRIDIETKNWTFLESSHFRLPTGVGIFEKSRKTWPQ